MAHVIQHILVEQLVDVVANISASRYMGFNETELTAEGHSHKKALHISVIFVDTLISKVLVDTDSLLNVLPKITLSQLQYEGKEMRASTLIVRNINGSRREVDGEVDLPIRVGPHQFIINLQVMNIHCLYSS